MKVNYFVEDLKQYLEWRESRAWVFLEVEKEHHKEYLSPCKKYKLDIYKYPTHEGKSNYTEGVITRLADNKELGSVKRNYDSFPYIFINNYLICGEDYQGYSIVDLEKEEHNVYFPDEGFKGHGFCWACMYGVSDSNKLVVEGCYWGGQYEVVVYDFSNPTLLPLPELERFEVDGYAKLEGNTLTIEQELEYRLSDGAFYNDLSEEEQKILDANHKLRSYKMVTLVRLI